MRGPAGILMDTAAAKQKILKSKLNLVTPACIVEAVVPECVSAVISILIMLFANAFVP